MANPMSKAFCMQCQTQLRGALTQLLRRHSRLLGRVGDSEDELRQRQPLVLALGSLRCRLSRLGIRHGCACSLFRLLLALHCLTRRPVGNSSACCLIRRLLRLCH